MPTTVTSNSSLTISLPHDLAERVRAKVASGEFANESELIEAKLVETILHPLREELVHWMQTEGVRRLERMKADPTSALSHEEFWAQIEADDAANPL